MKKKKKKTNMIVPRKMKAIILRKRMFMLGMIMTFICG